MAAREQGRTRRTAFDANEARAAYAAEPVVKLSALQSLATADMRCDLELRGPYGADSIPIAHQRLRGRFSPTGSFAYRTRDSAVSLATNCAPRPPGKRLSALCDRRKDCFLDKGRRPYPSHNPLISAGALYAA